MYVYNIIQLRTNPMSLQRPKQLKTAGFCSVLNLHPCFFQKVVPQEHRKLVRHLTGAKACSFEGVGDTLTSGAFLL